MMMVLVLVCYYCKILPNKLSKSLHYDEVLRHVRKQAWTRTTTKKTMRNLMIEFNVRACVRTVFDGVLLKKLATLL